MGAKAGQKKGARFFLAAVVVVVVVAMVAVVVYGPEEWRNLSFKKLLFHEVASKITWKWRPKMLSKAAPLEVGPLKVTPGH